MTICLTLSFSPSFTLTRPALYLSPYSHPPPSLSLSHFCSRSRSRSRALCSSGVVTIDPAGPSQGVVVLPVVATPPPPPCPLSSFTSQIEIRSARGPYLDARALLCKVGWLLAVARLSVYLRRTTNRPWAVHVTMTRDGKISREYFTKHGTGDFRELLRELISRGSKSRPVAEPAPFSVNF